MRGLRSATAATAAAVMAFGGLGPATAQERPTAPEEANTVDVPAVVAPSPVTQRITVTPGRPHVGHLLAVNESPKTAQTNIVLQDFVLDRKGGVVHLPEGTPAPSTLTPYITFNPSSVRLEPGEKVKVRYEISLPEDARGTFHTMAIFRTDQAAADLDMPEDGLSLQMFYEIGSILYADAEGTLDPRGTIEAFEAVTAYDVGLEDSADGLGPDETVGFLVTLHNDGNSVIGARGRINLLDDTGEEIDTLSVSGITLPGAGVDLYVPWPRDRPVAPGLYVARLVLDDTGLDDILTGSVVFEVGPTSSPGSIETASHRSDERPADE